MRLTRWPTASCISRAIRVRSLSTASRAMSSRSASARSARSVSAVSSFSRVSAQAPIAPGRTTASSPPATAPIVSFSVCRVHGCVTATIADDGGADADRPPPLYRPTAYG